MKFIGLRTVYAALASFALAGCGGGGGDGGSGGSSTYSITATVTGLSSAVTILNNGANPVNLPAGTTSVVVASGLATGTAYTVTIQGIPAGQACGPVTAGTNVGTVGTSNVTIAFSCAPTFVVGGAITGLTATGLQIRLFPDFANAANIAGFNVSPAANSASYQFGIQVRGDISYIARIVAQPSGQTCRFANNTVDSTAPMNGAAAAVPVTCVNGSGPPIYTVGGTVTGHTGNVVVRLNGNSATDQTIASGSGTFTFAGTTLATGLPYAVTVVTSPSGQVCSADNGVGTVGTANVTNVVVTCSSVITGFTIGGTVSGASGPLVVTLNGANNLIVNGNGAFTFAPRLATGATYAVLASSPPAGQTCSITGGSGTVSNANINVAVACSNAANAFTVGGVVNGASGPITLLLNGTADETFAGPGFVFSTPVAQGTNYNVGIFAPPTGQVCTPRNPTNVGTVGAANVTTVVIDCVNTGSISGTITGLTGSGLALQLNGANDLTVAANSSTFSFPAGITTSALYTAHIKTQPAGQTCTIIRAQGTISFNGPNIASINPNAPAVACVNNVTSPLSGTFAIPAVSVRAFLSFYPDGTYILGVHNDDPACNANNGNGIEYGAYNWNATTNAFSVVTAAIDTNGGCGIVNGAALTTGTLIKNVDGTLSADFIDTDGSGNHNLYTLVPVASTAGQLIGSWGDNQAFTVYSANGTLFSAQTKGLAQNVNFPPGLEDGCYQLTGTTASGSYTVNLTASCHVSGTQVGVDTTGALGVSIVNSNPWNFNVTGDLLQVAVAPAVPSGVGFTRIVTN